MYSELVDKIIDKKITKEQALAECRGMTIDQLQEFIFDFEMIYNMYDDPDHPDLYNRLSDLYWEMEEILENKKEEK